MKRTAAILIALGALIVVGILALMWFSASGTGEYADSPNGRYTAHVTNLEHGTFLSGRIKYIEIKLETASNGKTVWVVQRFPQPGEIAPDYGSRQQKFIKWAPDSTSFSVPVGAATDSVWNVP